MASADSEVADSPDVASFGPSTPAGGSSIAGHGGGVGAGAGIKRGLGDDDVDLCQASATANAAAEPKKKKKTGTSSRGVANLTPEQLAKKRANGTSHSSCSPACRFARFQFGHYRCLVVIYA